MTEQTQKENLGPLVQLQLFADYENNVRPPPDGKKHVATWAVEEIERLMLENANLYKRIAMIKRHLLEQTNLSREYASKI